MDYRELGLLIHDSSIGFMKGGLFVVLFFFIFKDKPKAMLLIFVNFLLLNVTNISFIKNPYFAKIFEFTYSQFSIHHSYLFIIMCATYILVKKKVKIQSFSMVPVFVYLLIAFIFVWRHDDYLVQGIFHFLMLAGIWIIGEYLGRDGEFNFKNSRFYAYVMFGVSLALFLLVFISCVYWAGFRLDGIIATIFSAQSNMYNNHIDYAEKMIFMVPLALAGVRSSDKTTRKFSIAAVALFSLNCIWAWSRITTVALFIMLITYVLISFRKQIISHWKLSGGVLAGILVFGAIISPKVYNLVFNSQHYDHIRHNLMQVAWNQFVKTPFVGIGPNHFVIDVTANSILGLTSCEMDGFVCTYPVHNSMMLLLVDIGIIGVILLLIPVIYSWVKSIIHLHKARANQTITSGVNAAIINISFGIPLIMLFMFDYGTVSDEKMLLLFFMLAFLQGSRVEKQADEQISVHFPQSFEPIHSSKSSMKVGDDA